jgi:hypothetical protein
MKKFYKILFLLLASCSTQDATRSDALNLGVLTSKDYSDHLASLGQTYLANDSNQEIKLKKESSTYLNEIYERIVTNNESLLKNEGGPHFHIIDNKTPFIFSLPKSQFFISSGLMEKYLKSEELFVAAISAEVLKSERNIYEKNTIIPLGFISNEQLIRLSRLHPENKYRVNEWSYFVLKRAGFDATAYLNWIQVQNRNPLDFSLYLGDAVGASREELLFKNFMSKQGISAIEKKLNEANSSKSFYKLLSNIASKK